MTHSTEQDLRDTVAAEFEDLARRNHVPLSLQKALQELQTAMSYQDVTLMKSHLNAVYEAMSDMVRDMINGQLGLPQRIRRAWNRVLGLIKGCPIDYPDELASKFESVIGDQLNSLIGLRDGVVKHLECAGYDVENAPQLKQEIVETEGLKKAIAQSWPGKSLPAVDRKMIAESKSRSARGENGDEIDDLLLRAGTAPR